MKHLTTSKPLFWRMDSLYKLYNWCNAWTWSQSIGQIFIKGTVSFESHCENILINLRINPYYTIKYAEACWTRLGCVSGIRWHNQILAEILEAELASSPMLESQPRSCRSWQQHHAPRCDDDCCVIATSWEWRLWSNGACTTTPLSKLLVERQENREYK